jgi:glycoside/pentoside/hexuronide:cation symporter, GPH family
LIKNKGTANLSTCLSVVLALALMITFASTKERVKPLKTQQSNLWKDLKDLIRNKPWVILLLIGLLFQVYNSIKQGIVVIYFTHYLHNQLLAGSYMVALMLASIGGAMATGFLGKLWGKRKLFIYAFIFSGAVNALFMFCGPRTRGHFCHRHYFGIWCGHLPNAILCHVGRCSRLLGIKNGRRATGLFTRQVRSRPNLAVA